LIESLFTDVRFALRWLRKSPAFALVAVASLAIGIGFNTALFAMVDAVLFRPLPVADPDRLVDVFTSGANSTAVERYSTSSYPDYLDVRAQNEVFEDIVGYTPMFGPLNLGDRSRLVLGEIVTGNYFKVLGVGAAAGRPIQPDDDRPGAPRVVMISTNYWTRELGASPSAIGQTLKLRGDVYTIVGVAPRGFNGMTPVLSPDLWVPVSASLGVEPFGMHDVVPSPNGATRLERRGDRWLFMRGRLKSGKTIEQAHANLDLVMKRLDAAYPATNASRQIAVKATSDVHVHPSLDPGVVPMALALMVVVGLVLLIACANVASMLLARASGRQKEIGIRLAIGATRGRLARQLVTESLVMSAIGATAGVLLAWWLTRVVMALPLPTPVPLAFDLRIDTRVLLFTTVAAVVAGVLAGLAPAFKASKLNVTAEMRGEVAVAAEIAKRWTVRDVLVAGQIAITAVLLVIAALLTRSLIASERANLGFSAEHLAVLSTDTGMAGYTPERSRLFYDEATARVRGIPGVHAVALATRVPLSVNPNRWEIWVPGRHDATSQPDVIDVTRVSPEYFETIGVAILQGRNFTSADRPETGRVAIVNETMARKYWPGESAIGKIFRTRNAQGPAIEVVGVSADHKISAVGEPPTPFIQMARSQQPNSYSFIVARTRGDAGALLRDMRRELLALEPNLVFVENQTMEAELATTLFPVRMGATIVAVVGIVAMLLAAIGLYGVIAYSVSRRTREIGIRMALGARPSAVLSQMMRHGFIVTCAGLLVGALLAAAAAITGAHAITGLLYGVSIADPISWGSAAVLLVAVSSLANFIPAWRAARVQPSVALRTD
jgi:macrolide transport system ATP-binding/permease protein